MAAALDDYFGSRLTSGHARLDAILGGGLWDDAITMVTGPPGTGKTLLAQQYVFANATEQRPALYISTVSEPMDKLLRFGRSLDYFDPDAIGRSVFYEDLGTLLDERGLPAFAGRVDELVSERVPGMIVIDSFKALHAFAREASDFRWFLHDFAGRLTQSGAATFWVGEYLPDDIAREPEFAVADAIIQLGSDLSDARELRALQVLKLRGSAFQSGRHAYRLSARGIDVFPRLADARDDALYELSDDRVSSGIPALDAMIGDGYWPGASTLVAGPSGAGKTIMALSFIFEGARTGERGLIANMQENTSQLQRTARGFGWSLDNPHIDLMYRTSVDLYIDEWVHDLLERADATQAKRVVIDSLGDLAFAAPDHVRFREYVYSLVQRCSRGGISLLMTMEVPDLFDIRQLSETGVSNMSDNVVLLQFVRTAAKLSRSLTVLKTRAALQELEVRNYIIDERGIVLSDAE
jgi:circadian clock protein KaiC